MDLDALKAAVAKGDVKTSVEATGQALAEGLEARRILDDGLIAAMNTVGERFSAGKIFVPQMLRAARTMQECVALLQPHFQEGETASKGRMVLGSVKGDLHDIGKNLVAMMMSGAGFEVADLGVDVPPDRFAQKVKEVEADLVGLSALLATTMTAMKDTLEALEKAGVRDRVKVLIGGAPVTSRYAEEIGADGYAPDAGSAVTEAKKLLGTD